MIRKIEAAIKKHNLLSSADHIMIAVSGGADSISLLHAINRIAQKLKFKISAVHVNHSIRGKASDKDAEFVKQTADKLNIPFFDCKANVPARAKKKGISLEMAAREVRYEFFAKTATKISANKVATAHTADDQAETIILKLARGAGSSGLSGISPSTTLQGLNIIRPMLNIRRREIISYLEENNIAWREDASNKDLSFLRNRVRHKTLPELESDLNPNIREALIRAATILSDEDTYLDETAKDILGAVSNQLPLNDIQPLSSLSPAISRRVIRKWLVKNGLPAEMISFDNVERVEKMIRGKKGSGSANILGNWIVRKQYSQLILEESQDLDPEEFKIALPASGETVLPIHNLRISVTKEPGLIKDKPVRAGILPSRASISLSSVGRKKIYIRSWRAGDKMKPLGLNGTKKLQDIFVDEKVPADQRSTIPLFECANEIIWIPGYRVAKGWEIANSAKDAIQITVDRL